MLDLISGPKLTRIVIIIKSYWKIVSQNRKKDSFFIKIDNNMFTTYYMYVHFPSE